MNLNRTIFAVLALTTTAIFAASEAEVQGRPDPDRAVPKMLERPHLRPYTEPDLKPGATLTAFELTWNHRNTEEVSRRLYGAIGVLLDEGSAARIAESDVLDNVVRGEEAGSWSRLGHSPVLAKYQSEYDEIRIIHEELSVISRPASDVGEEGVRGLAEQYLKRLGKAGVVDPRLYKDAAMQLGYKMVGEGSIDQKPGPGWIVEYRITFRPRLHGFEMANAGVRMGILASGELSSLRVGGVTPAGKWSNGQLASSVRNSQRKIRIGTDDLMRYFHKQVSEGAEPQVAWSRVMYAMPPGKSAAVVEPMLLISYTETREVGKQRVTSRRKTLGFSLTDPRAAPVDFDPPAPRHEDIRITREDKQSGKD